MKSSILILLLSFIIGIISASLFTVHWVILFTCWTTFLLSLMVVSTYGRQILFFRKWITFNIIIVFAFSGMLGYHLQLPSSYNNEFSENYLENDQLIGEVIEYQKGKGDYDKAIVELNKIISPYKETKVQGKLLCYIRSYEDRITEGHVILFQPNIQDITNKNNPGEFNAEKYWKTKGINQIAFTPEESIQIIGKTSSFSNFWSRSRDYLINVVKANIKEENQGLVIALSLGDKSNLSMEKRDHFANAGAMHVLAVSGMHVGILLWFIELIFKSFKFLRKRNLYIYFALISLWCFAFLTGMSASVVRAVMMFSIMGFGQLMGKKFFGLHAIFASALLLLIFNPLVLFDIGFQLSYLAVLGISLFYQPIVKLFTSSHKIINWFWQGTVIGIAAQIGTVPISLIYFNQFPNYFFLTNIGLLVLAFIAFIGVLVLFISHLIPMLVDALSYLVNLIFDILTYFITWINSLPGEVSTGFTPHILQVALLYIAILFSLYQWQKGNFKKFIFTVLFLFVLSVSLIYNRENNKLKKELIVLNHYEKVILLKENRKLFLLYDGEKNPSTSALNYLSKGYENAVGVKASILPLPKDLRIKLSKEIWFENSGQGVKLNYYGKRYLLADKVSKKPLFTDYKVVKGSWSPFLAEEYIDIDTQQKALRITPSDK